MRVCNFLRYLCLVGFTKRRSYQPRNQSFAVNDAGHAFRQIEKVCTTF